MKKHAHIKQNQTAETHSDETSGGASFDNTTTASAGVETQDALNRAAEDAKKSKWNPKNWF